MYALDPGIHIEEYMAAKERKEKARRKEAKQKAREERELAEAQLQAQAAVQIQVQPQAQTAVAQSTQSAPISPRPQSTPGKFQKPGPITMPFGVFQDQMRKGMPSNTLQLPQQRPGAPNRTVSFPAFPTGFNKASGPNSGLSSMASSAYNSPLPSPGLSDAARKAFFPFAPKVDSDRSRNPVSCAL